MSDLQLSKVKKIKFHVLICPVSFTIVPQCLDNYTIYHYMHPVKKYVYKLPLKVEKQHIQSERHLPLRLIKSSA